MGEMKAKIFINGAPFTADNDTIDQVIAALKLAGFIFDESTNGYVSAGFFEEFMANKPDEKPSPGDFSWLKPDPYWI